MEMDDPWGSPWAEEVRIHPDFESTKAEQSAKPTTPVRASTVALEVKTHSPWDDRDDGGFGDWAGVSADDKVTLGHNVTSGEWEGNRDEIPQLKDNLPSALTWDNDADATISAKSFPKLSPSLMPKSPGFDRQPSPDPWATNFQEEDNRSPTLGIQNREKERMQLDGSCHSDSEESEAGQETEPLSEELLGDPPSPRAPSNHGDAGEDSVPSPVEEEPVETSLVVAKSRASNEILDAEIVPSSRPSSSPSEHSHHEENLPDSPRTSIDDEPKRPYVTRKVSSKIQELVEHFDSLAQPEEIPEPIRALREDSSEALGSSLSGNTEKELSPVASEVDSQSEDDTDDFGDFEEGNSEDEDSIAIAGSAHIPGPVQTSLQQNDNRQERFAVSKEVLGPVTFDLNTSILETLYPDNEVTVSTERVFIPDRDLDNTLASTEQRKTWYRISRYGTKRKHDTGDDENYARANWAQSQMRHDTLQIVARWMEEDRISGRVVLGGISKGSSVFGWADMKAAPVPIAQAFAAKRGQKPEPSATAQLPDVPREWPKGLVKSRSSSKSRSPPKARRRSSVKSQSISGDPSTSKTPAANFGWSSSPIPDQSLASINIKTSSSTAPSQSPPRKSESSHRTTSSVTSISGITHKNLPPVVIPAAIPVSVLKPDLRISPNPIISQLQTEEEEDDWGEMVASPVIATAPVLPTASKAREHSKTQSFGSPLETILDVPQSPFLHSKVQTPGVSHSAKEHSEPSTAPKATTLPVLLPQTNDLRGLGLEIIPSQSPVSTAFVPAASQVADASGDPWASADFSFFEAPTLPASNPANVMPKANVSKTVKFSDPATTSVTKSKWKSKEEMEQDRIVRSVVKGLPNLSYMLRR